MFLYFNEKVDSICRGRVIPFSEIKRIAEADDGCTHLVTHDNVTYYPIEPIDIIKDRLLGGK